MLCAPGVEYVPLEKLYADNDIITLHCPLNPQTYHLIDVAAIAHMKQGAMLINTSRGAVIDTRAVIEGLKSLKIGYLGLDVYEQEGDLFFQDLSDQVLKDDVFGRLLNFPNVLITGHQDSLLLKHYPALHKPLCHSAKHPRNRARRDMPE